MKLTRFGLFEKCRQLGRRVRHEEGETARVSAAEGLLSCSCAVYQSVASGTSLFSGGTAGQLMKEQARGSERMERKGPEGMKRKCSATFLPPSTSHRRQLSAYKGHPDRTGLSGSALDVKQLPPAEPPRGAQWRGKPSGAATTTNRVADRAFRLFASAAQPTYLERQTAVRACSTGQHHHTSGGDQCNMNRCQPSCRGISSQ